MTKVLNTQSYLQYTKKLKGYLTKNNNLKKRKLTGLNVYQHKYTSKLIKQYRILGILSFTTKLRITF